MVKGQVLESGRARFKYDTLHSVIWGTFYNDVPNMSKDGLVSSSSKSRTTESEYGWDHVNIKHLPPCRGLMNSFSLSSFLNSD